jgi:hypothetical protein
VIFGIGYRAPSFVAFWSLAEALSVVTLGSILPFLVKCINGKNRRFSSGHHFSDGWPHFSEFAVRHPCADLTS